jgi:hypothetical protein
MRIARFLIAMLMPLGLDASRLEAQDAAAAAVGLGGVDQLLSRVESINIYYGGSLGRSSGNSANGPRVPWAKDYGLEFLLHVGEFGGFTAAHVRRAQELEQRRRSALDSLRGVRAERLRTSPPMTAAARAEFHRKFAADSARIVGEPEMPFKTTSITVKKHVSIVGRDTVLVGVDSEFVGNREPPPADERRFDFDLGIGYGQMDGLSSGPPFELHGSVRELPSVSAYATARLTDRLGIYAGVRTGIITLQDAQLYVLTDTSTALFTLSSTSFEFGAPLGIDVQAAGDIHLTLEAAYMRRIFNSLSYDPSSGFPSNSPRSLDLSGLSWSIGVQFPLP